MALGNRPRNWVGRYLPTEIAGVSGLGSRRELGVGMPPRPSARNRRCPTDSTPTRHRAKPGDDGWRTGVVDVSKSCKSMWNDPSKISMCCCYTNTQMLQLRVTVSDHVAKASFQSPPLRSEIQTTSDKTRKVTRDPSRASHSQSPWPLTCRSCVAGRRQMPPSAVRPRARRAPSTAHSRAR